jgi:hypothetical protein
MDILMPMWKYQGSLAGNGLQLTDSFCFSQKFWLGAVIGMCFKLLAWKFKL